MKKVDKKILILTCLFFFFVFVAQVDAATLYLLPESKTFGIGQEFSVDIKVNTEDVSINATQATIRFPTGILELLSADKEGSTFRFWIEEPVISNEAGTLRFIGGTAKGVSGESLQVLKMKFKAKGVGVAELTVTEAVVAAADGKGTNVLSTIEGTSISVGTEVVKPEPPPTPVEQPEKVEREPIPAEDLPGEPKLKMSLYPDEKKWYSHLGEVIVLWEVPGDIIKVAASLDQNPNAEPEDIEEELFTGKTFGILEEGIWYIHVQFKNNIGWGSVTHYKIFIDTTTPLPFEIQIDTGVSDNPTPEIKYETQDSLSGISHALIFIDDKDPIESTETVTKLPVQPPGKHTVLVRILDLAGNGVEDDLEFETLPLPTPTIDFVTKTVSQGEFVFASGKAIPNGFIDARVFNKAEQEVFVGVTDTDGLGNWEIIIEESLDRGKYALTATARDDRGAISYPTEPEAVKIRAKTILSIGFVDLGWFEVILIILLLVVSGASIGAWYYTSLKKRRAAYKIIAGRDIDKLTTLLAEDLKELESLAQGSKEGFKERARPEIEFRLKSMRDTVGRMKKYLGHELDKLR